MAPWTELWALSRPRAGVIIAASPLIGYWFGLWEHASPLRNEHEIPLVLVTWWLVHAGSVWLNAHLDRDEGVVLWGTPQHVPNATRAAGAWALVLAVALAAFIRASSCLLTLAAAGLAVAYSHPRWAWKARPVAGPCVNLVGYGLLSPSSGWVVADVPATPRTVAAAALLGATALSVYFLAQVFQEVEDRARGYRTLVAIRGAAAVVSAARWCLGLAFGGLAVLSLVGWLPRLCLLVLPGWLRLDRWLRDRGERASERDVRSYVLSILASGVGLMFLALVDFWLAPDSHEVAGQGTRARW